MRVSGVRGFFSKPRAFTKATIVRLDFPERQKLCLRPNNRYQMGKLTRPNHLRPVGTPNRLRTKKLRLRAYEIFVARGAGQVDDVPNWLIAEQDELQVTYVNAFRQSLIRCIAGSSKAQKLAWY